MPLSEILYKERPRVITVVGYIFVGASILMVVSSVMAFIMFSLIPKFGNMPEFPGPLNFLFQNYRYFAAGEAIVGALMILVSCNFLLGKNWTRFVLQVYLVAFLIFMVFFCKLWSDTWTSATPDGIFKSVGVFVAIVTGIFWGGISGAGIVFLHSKKVRQFCAKKSEIN
jgi:hypothetical protein